MNRLRKDIIELDQKKSKKLERQLMAYEELRTYTFQVYTKLQNMIDLRNALEVSLKREVVQGMKHVASLS